MGGRSNNGEGERRCRNGLSKLLPGGWIWKIADIAAEDDGQVFLVRWSNLDPATPG